MPAYTLTLDNDTAEKILNIVDPVGGTVAGFARRHVTNYMALPPEDRAAVDALINSRLPKKFTRRVLGEPLTAAVG